MMSVVASCATNTQIPHLVESDTYCDIADELSYNPTIDSINTMYQIDKHNCVYLAVCNYEKYKTVRNYCETKRVKE